MKKTDRTKERNKQLYNNRDFNTHPQWIKFPDRRCVRDGRHSTVNLDRTYIQNSLPNNDSVCILLKGTQSSFPR